MLCTSCGVLVGVNDDKCYNCGRRNPALWGFAPLLRSLGNDLGFTPFVFGLCTVMFGLTVIGSSGLSSGGLFGMLAPDGRILYLFGASGAGPVFGDGRWWTVLSAAWLHGGILHFGLNMLSFLFVLGVVGDLVVLPFWIGEMALGRYIAWTPVTLVALLSVALFSSVLAYIFWKRGVEAVGAQVAGLFIHLMPVFGVILAWLFLDERLHSYHVAGIALILTGIGLTTRRGRAVVPAGTD